MEDYLIYGIKGYDEIKSLSKSQSKHFDQSIPHENPAENTTEDVMQEHNSEKVEETDIEKIDPNPLVIEGIKEDQEVPKTDDLVDDSGINKKTVLKNHKNFLMKVVMTVMQMTVMYAIVVLLKKRKVNWMVLQRRNLLHLLVVKVLWNYNHQVDLLRYQ